MSVEIIRVFVTDDHPIVRQGLEIVINSQPDMKLIGQATDGVETLKMLGDLIARDAKPDVIIIDLKMPNKGGLATIDEIKKADAETKILVLTSFPEDEAVLSAIKLGTNGVMVKDATPEQLLAAIRDVYHGVYTLHPSVTHTLMLKIQQSAAPAKAQHPLTNREIDVLKCLAQGLSNREIASSLSISIRTVTTHVRDILDKLGLENRTQAALYAVEHKIVN